MLSRCAIKRELYVWLVLVALVAIMNFLWVLLGVAGEALYAEMPAVGSLDYLTMMAIGIVWPIWPAVFAAIVIAIGGLMTRAYEKIRRELNCE